METGGDGETAGRVEIPRRLAGVEITGMMDGVPSKQELIGSGFKTRPTV